VPSRGEKLIEEDIVFNPVEVDNTESINIPSNNKPVHLLNKFIVFDEQQTDVLQCELPLIVIGSAGSGKTSVTLEKLKELKGRILYISLSSHLVHHSQKLYFSFNYCNEKQDIDFLSFKEFLETIDIPKGTQVTEMSMSIKNVPVICNKSVPVIIKNFTSFFLRVFKFFHTITFTLYIEDRCIMH
jgi:hypothetical protein